MTYEDAEGWTTLADPNRRSILMELAVGERTVSELTQVLPVSQPAVSQHLSVLRAAGLVREQRQGRFVNYEVDPEGIVAIGAWLARYRAYWPKRMEALADLLKDMDQ